MKLSLVLFFLFPVFFSGNDWEQKLDKNGVSVYMRPSANSKIKSIRSVVRINASPEKIKSIILDIPHYPNWVYKCGKAEVIKKLSEKEIYYYQTTLAPFPVRDRDLVALVKVSEKENEIIITIKAQPDKVDRKKEMVRVELFDSVWKIKKGKDQTEVTNEMTVDPGGGIPAWLVNSVSSEGPYNTSLKLRETAERK